MTEEIFDLIRKQKPSLLTPEVPTAFAPSPIPKPRVKPLGGNAFAQDELALARDRSAYSDPKQAARNRGLSASLGVNPILLPPDAEAQAFVKKRSEMDKLIENNPGLARFLLKQKNNAEVVGRDYEPMERTEILLKRLFTDPMVSALKGVVSFNEALVGLLDTRLGGRVGKGLEDAGFKFKATQKILDQAYSEPTQRLIKEIGETEGFLETVEALVTRPSAAANMLLQSGGPMLGAGGIAQGLLKVAPALSPLVAGALGESLVITGGISEKVRQESPDGLTDARQALLAQAGGAAGFAFNLLGGKIAAKLGVTDVDTWMASGAAKKVMDEAKVPPSLVAKILGGAAVEGAVQEMPQSAAEVIAENIALGKPWNRGVEEAMATGLVLGSVMGAGVQALPTRNTTVDKALDTSALKKFKELSQAAHAQETRKILGDLAKETASNPVRERSPEAFAEFIDEVTEDSVVKELYVDAKALDETLSQSELEAMPEVAKDISVALQAGGGDVRIPMSLYATHISGKPIEAALIDNVRATPDGMTFSESENFLQSLQTNLEDEARRLVIENDPVLSEADFKQQNPEGSYPDYLKAHANKAEVFANDLRTVHDTLVKSIESTGRFDRTVAELYATPLREFFANNAAKLGMMPSELYELLPVNFASTHVEGYKQDEDPSKLNTNRPGGDTAAFFAKMTLGLDGVPGAAYEPVIPLRAEHREFLREYEKHRGNFDNHIRASIPGFGEVQVLTGRAIVSTYTNGAAVLDVGASEGSWAKTITALSNSSIETDALEPLSTMKNFFVDKSTVPGARQLMMPWGGNGWPEEGTGVVIPPFRLDRQYDVVHESMTFQFINNDRTAHVALVKQALKPDGVFLTEEKFSSDGTAEYKAREAQKDQYKARYFTAAAMTQKAEQVVVGMHGNMVPQNEYEKTLAANFKYVVQYWSSTNFGGYAASDDLEALTRLVDNIGNTTTEFSADATLEDFAADRIRGIFSKKNWGIVTAENPNATQQSEAQNQAANAALRAELDAKGLKYVEVKGMYPGDLKESNSFLVFGIDSDAAVDIGQRYGQEAVLTPRGLEFSDGRLLAPVLPSELVEDVANAPRGYTKIPGDAAFTVTDFREPPRPAAPSQPGSISLVGVHYSRESRAILEGDRYGTGRPGAERERVLFGSDNQKLKTRIDFYVDIGNGVKPEEGVGDTRHDVVLHNLYDASKNERGFKADSNRFDGMNRFENQVIEAGYDGYYVEQGGQGRVVLLGDAAKSVRVPSRNEIDSLAARAKRQAEGYNQSELYSALARNIEGLRKLANKKGLIKIEQAKTWINSRVAEGKFKKEEVEAVGLLDYLNGILEDAASGKRDKIDPSERESVSVEAVLEYVRENGVQVEIISSDEGQATRYYFYDRNGDRQEYDDYSRAERERDYAYDQEIRDLYDELIDVNYVDRPYHHGGRLLYLVLDNDRAVTYELGEEEEDGSRVWYAEDEYGSNLVRDGRVPDAIPEDDTDELIETLQDFVNGHIDDIQQEADIQTTDVEEEEASGDTEFGRYTLKGSRDEYVELAITLPTSRFGSFEYSTHDFSNPDANNNRIAFARYTIRTFRVSNDEERDRLRAELDSVPLDDTKVPLQEAVHKVLDNLAQERFSRDANEHEMETVLGLLSWKVQGEKSDAFGYSSETWRIIENAPEYPELLALTKKHLETIEKRTELKSALRSLIDNGAYKRVLVIEELQSDWAQQGRDIGFAYEMGKEDDARMKALEAELTQLEKAKHKELLETNPDQQVIAELARKMAVIPQKMSYLRKGLTEEEIEADTLLETPGTNARNNPRLKDLHRRGVVQSALNKLRTDIPRAPFTANTKSWLALVTKAVLRHAVEKGVDSVVWNTGEQQNARYSLSRLASSITLARDANYHYRIAQLLDANGSEVSIPYPIQGKLTLAEVKKAIGAELTDKAVEALNAAEDALPLGSMGPIQHTLDSEGLEVSGKGMRAFYDANGILEQVMRDVAKLGRSDIKGFDFTGVNEVDAERELAVQQGFDVTEGLSERVNAGMPLFQRARAGFNPDTLTISLSQGADLSSVIHEAGHFYLEALAAMAKHPNAPQQIRDDFRKTLEWFGITGTEEGIPGGDLEQKAFHGSPHEFDMFSTSKIGSGEGAQAFGYGLYFASSKAVAEYYRDNVKDLKRVKEINTELSSLAEVMARYEIRYRKYSSPEGYAAAEKYDALIAERGDLIAKRGRVYEVELKPQEDEYLLWDTPISEQSEKVRAALLSAYDVEGIKLAEDLGYTGAQFYKNFDPESSEKDMSARLHALGIRGIKYRDGMGRNKGGDSYNYVIFSDNDVEIQSYYQGGEQTPSGGAIPTGTTPEEIWDRMTINQKRQYHEQWAQSFERYALEGKAPSVEMQSVFARFRDWMLRVYSGVKEFLRQNPLAGKLNDDIRAVFDRLLTSEDRIKEAEQIRSYQALFSSAEEAGVSPAVFRDYLELGERATEEAISLLSARSVRDLKWLSNAKGKALKTLQNTVRAVRKKLRREATAEVRNETVYAAIRFLKQGQLVDDQGELTKAERTFKLNERELVELGVDPSRFKGMTSATGLPLDQAATLLGYPSGGALAQAIAAAEPEFDRISALVDQRMLEQHGDLTTPEAMERAVELAIHNDVRARFLATGLKLLTEGKSRATAAQINKAAKLAADSVINDKRIRDIKPHAYTQAEGKASRQALARLPRDPQGAIEAQRAALLNNRLAKAAADAVEEVEQTVRYLSKFSNNGTRDNIDPDQLEQIDDLLELTDLRKGVTNRALDKRRSLAEWVEEQELAGINPAIDSALLEDIKRKHFKDMTLSELRSLSDTIKQIDHIGRLKKKLLSAREKAEFNALMALARESIEKNANRVVVEQESRTDVVGTLGAWGRFMLAAHRKFSSIIREMDGGKDGGIMWRILSRGMNEAGDKEVEMRQQAAEALAKLFDALPAQDHVPGNLYAKKKIVPGTNISMTHEQRIMFALNYGNEGNRQRLLDGGLSGHKALSIVDAEAILDTLTKADWDFVQGVLDFINGYWEQIVALEENVTGLSPKKVEAVPIVTKFGTYRGGYFPATYDTQLSTRSESLEAVTDLRSGMLGAFGRSSAKNGYAKARADSVVGRPLLLSFNAIAQHVSSVTHRLAWEPWLIDANRILRALDSSIREFYGADILREMRDTVVDIAQGDLPAKSPIERALNHLRTGATIVGMGWRVTTALLQPSGLAQSWVRIGGGWISKGLAQFMKNPNTASRYVNERSSLMRRRDATMNREVNDVLNTVRAGEKISIVKASFFTMITKMQRGVDIPTWLGAYEKALYEAKYEQAADEAARKEIEETAAAMADQAVLDSQSGGQIKDLAKVQRGHPALKLFTNFYSYFSATYNLNVEAVRRTDFKSPAQVGLLAGDLLLLNFVPVVFSLALKNMLKGECDWDDTACLAENLGREQASYLFGQMVLLREVGATVEAMTGGAQYGYSGPAGLRFLSDTYKLGVQLNQGEADLGLFKAANSVGGAILHYPAGQINATIDGIIAIENGDVEGVRILPALIAGAPK